MQESLRVGREDRDRYIEHLSNMYVQEYLTQEEFDQRVAQASTARTLAYLNGLVTDLPPLPSRQPARRSTRANAPLAWASVIIGVLMMTALILLMVM